MSRILFIAVLALCTAPLGAQSAKPAPAHIIELSAGPHRISAELAADNATRQRGLMHRKTLAENHGMLFVFDSAKPQCMWMRNTELALSVAFIADDGRIVNIERMQPHTDDLHCSAEPVRYALEMRQGWFSKHKLSPGAVINGIASAHSRVRTTMAPQKMTSMALEKMRRLMNT